LRDIRNLIVNLEGRRKGWMELSRSLRDLVLAIIKIVVIVIILLNFDLFKLYLYFS
jgi:hypothetical protein